MIPTPLALHEFQLSIFPKTAHFVPALSVRNKIIRPLLVHTPSFELSHESSFPIAVLCLTALDNIQLQLSSFQGNLLQHVASFILKNYVYCIHVQ